MILTFLTKITSCYWHIMDSQNGYTAKTAEGDISLSEIFKNQYSQVC